MTEKFLRRSLLYVPGSSLKMLEKAKGIDADAIILDLEDAVSISEKDNARANVANYISELKSPNKEIIVRINSMDSIWGFKDILQISKEKPDSVIVPKANRKSLITAGMMLLAAEKEFDLKPLSIGIIPLFETAEAIADAYKILAVSSRINGVQLGAEDLTKELEIVRTAEGHEIYFARNQIAMAARARGIDIIDTPYIEIKDLEGLRRDTENAKSIGFTGKVCIHPSHIETINSVFSPTETEIIQAKNIVKAFEDAVSEGKGACMYNNKMIDAPIAERAKKIIEKAGKFSKHTEIKEETNGDFK